MCGIAGFSLTPQSKVKTRQLANAMLTAIEDRGNQASGYAFWRDDNFGYHSEAKPGSGLSLKFLPRKARTVILHTRLATHGPVSDNRNNHPVTSPNGNIALVHNGVIYNHNELRPHLDAKLPPVDTSVIPAVIEQYGLDSINRLDGDAAIAWLDKREPGLLHLARYQHSPLCVAQIEDGSFVFASTEALLWRVLIQLDLMPTWMHKPNELDYYTIRDGIITSTTVLPEPLFTGSSYAYGYYRNQTSGGKSSNYDIRYYDYDDYWDDEDDIYYPSPKASSQVPLDEILDEQPALFYNSETDQPDEKYWILAKDELAQASTYTYYAPWEYELWANELYYLANVPDLELLDYGEIDSQGILVSKKDVLAF